MEKRRYGNSKEVRDNKQVYRLSDPAPYLFLFRVRISIQGTVLKFCILHVFTRTDGKGKFLFSPIIIKNRFIKQPAGIDISKDGFHACLKEQPDDGRIKIKRSRSFSNDYEGFKGFPEWSVNMSKGMSLKFVPEATGCYYEDLAWFLHDNGQKACVVPANRIRHPYPEFECKKPRRTRRMQLLSRTSVWKEAWLKRTHRPSARGLSPVCVNC
ncbi:hypothetical protein Barb6XT_01604 [Bacteroidales bacterium Barb6XT]|nr:hypothetical protein Barb6XT_01604 [Bacteroidales bacterium Barb6XT]